jgi:hypothetical protein
MNHTLEVAYDGPRPWRPAARPTVTAPTSLLSGALAAGILAGATLPSMRAPGLGLLAVTLVVAGVVAWHVRDRVGPLSATYGALGVALAASAFWRDAGWVVVLDYVAASGLAVLCVTGGRTWSQLGRALLATVPAGLRAPGFLARPLRAQTRWIPSDQVAPVVRGTALAVALTTIFAVLFTTADQAFSRIVTDIALPSVDVGLLPARVATLVIVALGTAGLVLLRHCVPHGPERRPAQPGALRRVEWLLPLGTLVALFSAFVLVQLTVLYGGRTHVLETAGLTYAEYARAGFFQLLVVAVLALGVVAAAVHLVPHDRRADRVLLLGVLGALCALTVVVIVSAMTRLDTYVDAYGLTRLRVLVDLFLRWLVVVFALVMVAGATRRAAWLPRAVVGSAACALLLLTWSNPDARIARVDLTRAERTGSLDAAYLTGLSADALPALAASSDLSVRCLALEALIAAESDDSWTELNLARMTARRSSERFEGCPRTR